VRIRDEWIDAAVHYPIREGDLSGTLVTKHSKCTRQCALLIPNLGTVVPIPGMVTQRTKRAAPWATLANHRTLEEREAIHSSCLQSRPSRTLASVYGVKSDDASRGDSDFLEVVSRRVSCGAIHLQSLEKRGLKILHQLLSRGALRIDARNLLSSRSTVQRLSERLRCIRCA
jgi:hypothetical protein